MEENTIPYLDPITLLKFVQIRQGELMKEAETGRLLQEARTDRGNPYDRLLASIGDQFITWGLKLGARHRPLGSRHIIVEH